MRLPFGKCAPDLPSLVNQSGLIQAKNMFPQQGGYEPMRGLSSLQGSTVLTARPRGAISGRDALGNGYLYAGDATGLWRRGDLGMTNISKSGGYGLFAGDRWSFAKFGDKIFAAAFNTTLQYHTIGTTDLFQDVPAFAPRARHIATVGNFLMSGNLFDAEGGLLPESIRWCAVDDPLNWPAFGSDAAVQVQADRLPLEGNGGWVNDIVSGAEIGIVFQERAIHRLDYRGGSTIFEKNRVEEGNGMFIPHSAVAYERQVFYIAEDGFRVFDYVTSHPVGKDRFSATFLADLDGDHIARVETGRDPDRTVIWIIYPGAGHVGGRPNKFILYDYRLDQFTHGALELEGLIENAVESLPSIDAPASAGDPDDVDGVATLDSYDDRPDTLGASRMGAFDSTFLASDFTGALLEGLIETGDLEGAPGRCFFLNEVRPLVDGVKPEISVATRFSRDEPVTFEEYRQMDADGKISLRREARYHRLRVKMAPGWDDAVGLDVNGRAAGER